MKNIWLHSIVIIFLAGILIALALTLAFPVVNILSALFPDPEAALRSLSPPALAFALLAPGLFSGWFVRRHPLLVGAAAGVLAVLLANRISPTEAESFSLFGEVIASAMMVAVAALAGRALRYRFKPGDNEASRAA